MEATPVIVFVRKGSPLSSRADALYEFSNIYAPIVELTHRDGRIEMTGIIRENWRRTATGAVSRNQ